MLKQKFINALISIFSKYFIFTQVYKNNYKVYKILIVIESLFIININL